MGVKDLWNILSPLCERKPLFELQGKAIAIDLSCWVVDSQTVTDNMAQPKMYLRNLFFRTTFLLMQGIWPVFVLEGTAPTLKHSTIAKRNDIRNGFQEKKTKTKGGRTQFNRILKECKQLLTYMGLVCVQGQGEAEAMCAYLNADGLVDGCISQDSDCFLYGAKTVYRNFCTSAQGNRGGTNGSVDEYSLEKIESTLHIGRNKMIALALLCGCDYNPGVPGIGKEAALKFFKTVDDEHVLERLQSWRTDTSFERLEIKLSNPNVCTTCGHPGKMQKHVKSGCEDCGTITKCNDTYKEKRALMLHEITLRKKALVLEDFPSQELIDEFLNRNTPVLRIETRWKQPQVYEFICFVEKHLAWEPQYAFQKIFPLATRWQLTQLPNISLEERMSLSELFMPEKIKKIRNIKCVSSYEIIWKSNHEIVERLKEYDVSDKENESDKDDVEELTSIEPQNHVLKCYPDLVEAFESLRNAKSKKKSGTSRAKKVPKDNTENSTNLPDDPKRRQRKTRKKLPEIKNNKKIDEFILQNGPLTLEESFEKMTITPKRSKQDNPFSKSTPLRDEETRNQTDQTNPILKRGPQFDKVLATAKSSTRLNNTLERMFNELSPEDFASENDDSDLNMSEIVEKVCSRKGLTFNFPTHTQTTVNTLNTEELIEERVRVDCNILNTSDGHMDDNIPADEKEILTNKSFDEFDQIVESYVPLSERVKTQSKRYSRVLHGIALPSGKQDRVENRFSFGFDALMNETDDIEDEHA